MSRKHTISSRDLATELVESYIIESGLQPNDRLPSEREMCAKWDLNRTTLRNAIQRLVDSGVLYCRMGSGTFVSPPKLVRNLQDVHGFSEAVREAGRVPGARLVYAVLREADKTIMRNLRVPLGTEVFDVKRVRTIDGIPCSIETTIVNTQNCKGIEQYDFETYEYSQDGAGAQPGGPGARLGGRRHGRLGGGQPDGKEADKR